METTCSQFYYLDLVFHADVENIVWVIKYCLVTFIWPFRDFCVFRSLLHENIAFSQFSLEL